MFYSDLSSVTPLNPAEKKHHESQGTQYPSIKEHTLNRNMKFPYGFKVNSLIQGYWVLVVPNTLKSWKPKP